MTDDEKFKVEQTLEMIEQKLTDESNSCEFDFYLRLKEELKDKLKGK
jgi:hypothetical protein